MIIMEDVTKTYSTGVAALNGINLHIQKGEFVFIVGNSGSGKSTLIKLLLKELEPTSGTIIVNDQNLGKMKRRKVPKYRRGVGVVFQDFRLLKDRNVYENVAFAQQVVEVPHRYIKRQVENMLEMVGLKDRMNAFPNELSGGEQQRVSIARALAKNPKLLLCDEPTGALDSNTSRDILVLLEQINQKYGTTMLIVTHNNSIKNMVHQVIRIKDGMIRECYENETRVPAAELEDL